MTNFNIAFDNRNVPLGIYFEKSKDDLLEYINSIVPVYVIDEINSLKCNQVYIDMAIPLINSNNFIFIAYSHGHKNRLVANGSFYIESTANSSLFSNCFFYSMSCHTAVELGKRLIANGTHAFIGYNNDAYALQGHYTQLSIDCDNFGMKRFIDGISIDSAFIQMKEKFTSSSDYLEENDEPLLASYLRKNRDALELFGDGGLTINDFQIV